MQHLLLHCSWMGMVWVTYACTGLSWVMEVILSKNFGLAGHLFTAQQEEKDYLGPSLFLVDLEGADTRAFDGEESSSYVYIENRLRTLLVQWKLAHGCKYLG